MDSRARLCYVCFVKKTHKTVLTGSICHNKHYQCMKLQHFKRVIPHWTTLSHLPILCRQEGIKYKQKLRPVTKLPQIYIKAVNKSAQWCPRNDFCILHILVWTKKRKYLNLYLDALILALRMSESGKKNMMTCNYKPISNKGTKCELYGYATFFTMFPGLRVPKPVKKINYLGCRQLKQFQTRMAGLVRLK